MISASLRGVLAAFSVAAAVQFSSIVLPEPASAQNNGGKGMPSAPPEPAFSLPEAVDGQVSGVIINAANAKSFKSIIISELYPLVRANLLELDAVKNLKYSPASFFGAGVQPAEPVELSEDGTANISGQLPIGLLYREIEQRNNKEDKQKLAWKILWNTESRLWSYKFLSSNFVISWLQGQKLIRQFGGRLTRLYPRVLSGDDKSIQLFRERIEIVAPSVIRGFVWLTLRFFGTEEDMLWLYSPVTSKVRQLTGTNRSDDILGTSITPDDLLIWSGKIDFVDIKDIQSVDGLAFFSSLEPRTVSRADKGVCMQVPGEAESTTEGVKSSRWNFENHRFSQAFGWVPVAAVSVPRRMWRIEVLGRDPYSLYGREVLYIDAETYVPMYKFVYNRAGYLWKLVLGIYSGMVAIDKSRSFIMPEHVVVDDLIAKNSYILEFNETAICDNFPLGVKLADFDPQRLVASNSNDNPQPGAKGE